MKSSKESLEKRGLVEENDKIKYLTMPIDELFKYMNSDKATERTSAIYALSRIYKCDEEKIISELLKRLSIEKALYTKIEICNALEKGNEKTAEMMVCYLGKIGNNQHKILPLKVSEKKSYPLPRDIIARTLAKMNTNILLTLMKILETEEKDKISEALDAIGFMIFYNKDLATLDNLNVIINVLKKYKNCEMIVWKVTLCLSAFPISKSIEILEEIEESQYSQVIVNEAKRSLNLIKKGEN